MRPRLRCCVRWFSAGMPCASRRVKVGSVAGGGERASADRDQPTQVPATNVFFNRADDLWSASLPASVQHRTGTPSRVTPVAIATRERPVRKSLERPPPRLDRTRIISVVDTAAALAGEVVVLLEFGQHVGPPDDSTSGEGFAVEVGPLHCPRSRGVRPTKRRSRATSHASLASCAILLTSRMERLTSSAPPVGNR